VDGTPNEAGPIRRIAELLVSYKGHAERAVFAITALGDQDVILGLPWLRQHNPEVDWKTGEVTMSRCPRECKVCKEEIDGEKRAKKEEVRRIRLCRSGPMPKVTMEEVEDEGDPECPDLSPDSDSDSDEEDVENRVEDGDRVFMVNVHGTEEHIRATGNISQRLAEAFHQNTTPKDFRDAVPNYLHDFEDVFSKESFDTLPE
jgi:hypothetical protein